jgi:predicted DNA repair protein MutK
MAGSSLFALLDDIAALLDDIAVMSKVAAKKTAGVLGDDLALNAQQVSGVKADRELPVVWAVAKGSFLNKLILVPIALLISALLPWLIQPLLMLGGAYLCFEGMEKIVHSFLHTKDTTEHQEKLNVYLDPKQNLVEFEKDKIKGAIRTDFILSAEIIVIALGTVATASLLNQFLVVSSIAIIMTAGVYGLVAGIVKLDDAGIYLLQKQNESISHTVYRKIGGGLLWFAPRLMKTLSVVGTAAMFLVGGSIINHGLPALHHVLENLLAWSSNISALATVASIVTPMIFDLVIGLTLGAITLILVNSASWLKRQLIH